MAGNVVINTAAEQVIFFKVMLKSLFFFEANCVFLEINNNQRKKNQ